MPEPRAIGFWGRSGSTKTSQVLHLIERAFKKTGKTTRMVITRDDNAKAVINGSGLVEIGAVDLYDATEDYRTAFSVQRWLSEGYWYRRSTEGKKVLAKQPQFKTTPEEFSKIWGYVWEGGTGMAEWLASSISQSAEKKAWNKPWAYEEKIGGDTLVFGGVAEQHIGLIQTTLLECVAQMKMNLPVEAIIWTFHDGHGEVGRKGSGELILGPKVMGQAITGSVPKYFQDFIHLVKEEVEVQSTDQLGNVISKKEQAVMAYFQQHMDQTAGLPCLAVIRVLPKYYPALLRKWSNGGLMLSYEQGITPLYDAMEQIEQHARNEGRKLAEQVKSLREQQGLEKGKGENQ